MTAASHYERQQAGLGLSLIQQIRKACDQISERPLANRLVRGAIRRKIVGRFPYSILYRMDKDEIIVVAVAHQRRRPGYWRGRM